jgi:two-component system, chemotaxis family, protein-glutamate methylesterase/glutaminase
MVEQCDLVVIGGSAGGLEPLKRLLGTLPRSTPTTVLVVVHASRAGDGRLPAILAAAGELRCACSGSASPFSSA